MAVSGYENLLFTFSRKTHQLSSTVISEQLLSDEKAFHILKNNMLMTKLRLYVLGFNRRKVDCENLLQGILSLQTVRHSGLRLPGMASLLKNLG